MQQLGLLFEREGVAIWSYRFKIIRFISIFITCILLQAFQFKLMNYCKKYLYSFSNYADFSNYSSFFNPNTYQLIKCRLILFQLLQNDFTFCYSLTCPLSSEYFTSLPISLCLLEKCSFGFKSSKSWLLTPAPNIFFFKF